LAARSGDPPCRWPPTPSPWPRSCFHSTGHRPLDCHRERQKVSCRKGGNWCRPGPDPRWQTLQKTRTFRSMDGELKSKQVAAAWAAGGHESERTLEAPAGIRPLTHPERRGTLSSMVVACTLGASIPSGSTSQENQRLGTDSGMVRCREGTPLHRGNQPPWTQQREPALGDEPLSIPPGTPDFVQR